MAQQPLEPIQGGTGIRNNNASTINISGNFPLTLTLTGSTGVILPTSGTLLTTASSSNYVASFKTTLSGLTPTAATTGAVTLAGTLGLSSGGTNASLTATAGGLVYGTGTALAVSAAGTANQFVLSGGAGAPTFLSNSTTIDATSGTATLTIGSPFTFSGTTNQITTTASGTSVTISIAGTYIGQTSITTLGTITSGTWNGTTLAIANGGTGQTGQTAAFDALSPLTTQGDIIYYNGTHNVRLGAGISGQFLQTQGTSANPIWATGSGGSGTVTSVSVTSANGFAGTVATSTITPAITIETSITGILYGNGTAINAASAGQFPTLNQSTTGNASTATNVAGGTANQIPYQTAANTTSFFSAADYGIPIYGSSGIPTSIARAAGVLQGSASANPVWTTTPTLTGTNFSGTAASLTVGNATAAVTATNIAGGAAGSLIYQTGSGATTTLAIGTSGSVLTAGSTAPQYVAQSTLSVGTASKLAGGAAGSIPYQTAAGATSFVAAGTNTYILTMAGGIPSWAAPASGSGTVTSVSVTSANGFTGTVATNTTTPAISIFTSVTGILVGNGSSVASATSSTSFPGYAAGIAGGAAGSLVYQTNSNATTTLALGTTGYILTAGAATPQYVAPSTVTVGTATNLSGTTVGSIPYQSASATTGYLADVATGSVLVSGGVGAAPAWSTTLTDTNMAPDIYTLLWLNI